MNAQEIYENFIMSRGPGDLVATQDELKSVAEEYQELAAAIAAVAAALEEGWTGEAAGAAERGAGPLVTQHAEASEALTVAQDLLSRQVESFWLAKNSVEPVPPVPPAPSSIANVVTLGSAGASYESFVTEASAAAQRNVAAMELWTNHSTYNTEMMPTSYGEISQPEVSIALAEPMIGGTGGGPSDSDVAPGQSPADATAEALPEAAAPPAAETSEASEATGPGPQAPGSGASGPLASGTQAAVAVPIEAPTPAAPGPAAPAPPAAPSPGLTVAPPPMSKPGTPAPGSQRPSPVPGGPRPGTPGPGSPGSGSQRPGAPAPGSPAPGSQRPGAPAPGSPTPGSQRPATPQPGPHPQPAAASRAARTAPGTPAATRPAAADDGEHERRYGVPDDKHFQPAEDGKKITDPRTGLPASVPVIGG